MSSWAQKCRDWFHDSLNVCLERETGLTNEAVPKKQQHDYNKGVKGKELWVKPYGNKEEPLCVVTPEELKEFDDDRLPSSIYKTVTASIWGASVTLKNVVQQSLGLTAPSDTDLKRWIVSSTICQFGRDGILHLAPYENLKTLLPDMKSFGTTLHYGGGFNTLDLRKIDIRYKQKFSFSVRPQDPAWSAAKLMLMHNLNHQLVLHKHPCLHVLATTLCAITRKHLPHADHPIRSLLDAHFKYTFAITGAVINTSHSILMEHANEFSPFDIDIDTMHSFHLQPSHKHLFRFDLDPNIEFAELSKQHIIYGTMMSEYYALIQKWVKEYAKKYFAWDSSDLYAAQKWWKAIRRHFGKRHLIPWTDTATLTPNLLLRILTSIVFSVSIQHSTDHIRYASIPAIHKPWSWHGPLPSTPLDSQATPDIPMYELFQAEAANKMFFGVNPQTALQDVSYGPKFPMDNSMLRHGLERLYFKYGYFEPSQIGVSIDW